FPLVGLFAAYPTYWTYRLSKARAPFERWMCGRRTLVSGAILTVLGGVLYAWLFGTGVLRV
ncbi:MAG: hypothetical protein LBI33_07025, partial [Propionibacteriaceae bacterium]|nr:hypothetical protein [Propionibacteriaceae bacterium]